MNEKIRICAVHPQSGKIFDYVELVIGEIAIKERFEAVKGGGQVIFFTREIIKKPSFVDYLRSGYNISFTAAIDFTGSNGHPSSPSSLHYIGSQMNEYQQSLLNVGSVIEPYDSDMMFPVYGFGGVPNHMGLRSTSHCFPLTGNPSQDAVYGAQGIAALYKQMLPQIGLSGPTNFGPLLEQFRLNCEAQARAGLKQYNVLLILTDGAICDMNDTLKKVVDLSYLPCSIIIIGVGGADFSLMEQLDGDDGVLTDSRGRAAVRDIVQFVEFRKCTQNGDLAEQVLKEVPNQLCKAMEFMGYQPVAVQQVVQFE